jgi:NTE family protein
MSGWYRDRMRIGLSLGSGGARGYAHIGVLRALEEANVKIDLINGSSIGAIIGGAYALYGSSDKIEQLAAQLAEQMHLSYAGIFQDQHSSNSFLHNWLVHAACNVSSLLTSIYSHNKNRRALEFIFGNNTFLDTSIPFAAVAVDLIKGESVSIEDGLLVDGVLASISIPGIFPPVERHNRLLVDGGVLASVPARELRSNGAGFVIAVELAQDDLISTGPNGLSLVTYVDALKGNLLTEWELAFADVTITVHLPGFDVLRFSSYDDAIAEGYAAAKQQLPCIVRAIDERRTG